MSGDAADDADVSDRLVVRRRRSALPVDHDDRRFLLVIQKRVHQRPDPRPVARFEKSMRDEVNVRLRVHADSKNRFGIVDVDKFRHVTVPVGERWELHVDDSRTEWTEVKKKIKNVEKLFFIQTY